MPKPRDIPMQRLQAADKRLGFLVCALLQPLRWFRRTSETPPAKLERVLLVKFWGIGSLQLLTPAVSALRRRHPGARLTLLTLRENAEFARGLGVFDEVLALDLHTGRGPLGWLRIFARLAGLVFALRRERFDGVFDFEFFTRVSALLSLLTGAGWTSGFEAPQVWRGRFHARAVPFNRYWHVARNFRALAGEGEGEIAHTDLSAFRFGADHSARVARLLAERGIATGVPYVVLNANAGGLSLERRWPRERFAELASALGEFDRTPVVLIGSGSEREYVAGLRVQVRSGPGLLIDLAGELSIAELCALLAGAGALVTNDSGPMHLGAALGTPTLGLFGPETPVMYAPIGRRTSALWRPPVCSPCINVHDNKVANCVRGHPECLTNLSVDEVLDELRLLLWDGVLHALPQRVPGVAEVAG
ncbi:MAG: glycosyltransferase family 9 protein [Planctomycetes bacterium]|nr:glycosyltransferase family 9 protein [Planctomycetota bacterium]